MPAGKPKGYPKTGGRVPGVPNKATTEFKHVVTDLLEKNAHNVEKWLAMVADGNPEHEVKPDPYRALDMLHKLAEYAFPKLARNEHTGADGGPLQVVIQRFSDAPDSAAQ